MSLKQDNCIYVHAEHSYQILKRRGPTVDVVVKCDQCKKLVDHVEVQYDVMKLGYWIEVTCHGEREHMFLGELDAYLIRDYTEGIAFRCQSSLDSSAGPLKSIGSL